MLDSPFVTSFFRVTKSSRGETILRGNVTRDHVVHVSGVRLGVFVSFPQKRNSIVFSSRVNYLHSDL